MRLSTRAPRFALLATALFAAAGGARAQGADPFAPTTRWTFAPSAGAPWIPASLDFAAGGDWLTAAGAVGSPRWMLFSTSAASAGGALAPWSTAPATAGALAGMAVRGGDSVRELFALCQVPDPD